MLKILQLMNYSDDGIPSTPVGCRYYAEYNKKDDTGEMGDLIEFLMFGAYFMSLGRRFVINFIYHIIIFGQVCHYFEGASRAIQGPV